MKKLILMFIFTLLCSVYSVSCFAQKNNSPSNALTLTKEASALIQVGRNSYEQTLSQALVKLDSALKVEPTFVECIMLKSSIQGKLGRYTDAISTLEKLIVLKKNIGMAYTMQGYLNDISGSKEKADEKYKLAIKEYGFQLSKHPDSIPILINKAAVTGYINGPEAGKKEYQDIIKKYPNDKSVSFFAEMYKNDPIEFEKLFDRKLIAFNVFK